MLRMPAMLAAGLPAGFPASLAAEQTALRMFRDAATEFEIARYTEPEYNSVLPAPHLRIFSRGSFLMASDQSGQLEPFLCDIKTGERRPLFTCNALDPATLTFAAGDRTVVCFDGRQLTTGSGRSARNVYEVPQGWERAPGFAVSDGGMTLCVERQGGESRVRAVPVLRGTASTVLESPKPIEALLAKPRSADILIRREGRLELFSPSGSLPGSTRAATPGKGSPSKTFAIPSPAGRVVAEQWSAGGSNLLYLLQPEERGQLTQLREYSFEAGRDRLIARTSQYVGFARNSDASVFAGVSANRASPYILLLVRVGRRELTLCEHRAPEAGQVSIFFTPNSQRLVFDTRRSGKSVIYGMALEKLVEQTEESSG
jgi:hypothetical protein